MTPSGSSVRRPMSRGIDAGSTRVAGSIGTPSAFASKNSPVGLTGFCATTASGQSATKPKLVNPTKRLLLIEWSSCSSLEFEASADDPRRVLALDAGRWIALIVDVQRHRQIEEIVANLVAQARARLREEIVTAAQVRRDLVVVIDLEVRACKVVREPILPIRDRARLGDAGELLVELAESELEIHGPVVEIPDVSADAGAEDRTILELLD